MTEVPHQKNGASLDWRREVIEGYRRIGYLRALEWQRCRRPDMAGEAVTEAEIQVGAFLREMETMGKASEPHSRSEVDDLDDASA